MLDISAALQIFIVLLALVISHVLARRGIEAITESGVAMLLGVVVGVVIALTKNEEPYERELLFNVGSTVLSCKNAGPFLSEICGCWPYSVVSVYRCNHLCILWQPVSPAILQMLQLLSPAATIRQLL